MIDSKYRISLDIHSTTSNVRLKCKRGDTSRIICATLTENGFPYHISEDCYAVFTATKPDGNVVFNKCKINDNVIEYEFTPQTAAVSGVTKCEIKLYGADDKLITSPSFVLVVSDTAYDEGDEIESEKEVDALTHLISESFKAIKKADIALGQAEQAIEAAQKIDDVKDIADEAQSAADQALEIAETVEQHVQRIEDDQQDMKDDVDRKLTAPSGAKVGQYLQITKVDAEGRVIEVTPVDAPAAGGIEGDLDMKGHMIDNIGTLSFAGPDGTAANGAWMAIDDVVESDGGEVSPVIKHYSNDQDAPVIYRNIAPGVEDRDAVNLAQLKTRLLAPIKAAVGQYIRITAVDENGAVTAVEAVDAPSGGGGADEVFAKLEDGTVASAEVEFDLSDANTPALVVSPDTAKVGQTIVVEEVDEGGNPTKWKAVDLPAGGAESGWSKLGDATISDAYEYEMLSAENGVITIDTSANNYDYLNSESGVKCLVIPKDITVKEEPKIIHLKVKDFTAGVFEIWNADNIQPTTDNFDVAKYKLSANNIAIIVLENIPDRDNYKLRVTTPAINVNGLRDFFNCTSMTGLSLEASSIVNVTGGGIIEIETTNCPYDERYYYQRIKVLWGKRYGGSGQETFDSIHIKPAGVGANKPKDGKIEIMSYSMVFTNGTRFELWGANDA